MNKIGIMIMNTIQSTYEIVGNGTSSKTSLSPIGSSLNIELNSKSPAVMDIILSNERAELENGACLIKKKKEDDGTTLFIIVLKILPEYQAE